MFDLTSLGLAITSARNILDILKNAKDAQLAMAITTEVINLQGKLLGVQQQALELQEEQRQLAEKNRELQEALALRGQITVVDEEYWIQKEGTRKDGPFCAPCYDTTGKFVRTMTDQYSQSNKGRICPVCRTQFFKAKPLPLISRS